MIAKHKILAIITAFYNIVAFACLPSEVTYRKAVIHDAPGIVTLIESHKEEDKKKIYILPKKFRLEAIESSINNGTIFVAHDTKNNIILGYKNLFLLDTQEKLTNVLEEMGYIGHNVKHIDTARFTNNDNYQEREIITPNTSIYDNSNTCIYIDMDLTHPDFRGQGINKKLADIGLTDIKQAINEHIKNNQSKKLVLLYGLTNFNDYDKNENRIGRTPGIVRSFASFIRNNVAKNQNPEIYHDRYVTAMPVYDEHATENNPLPYDQWVPASGNALYCMLNK